MVSNPKSYWTDDLLLTEVDVNRFEEVPLSQRGLPHSTYDLLMDGCGVDPAKVAIYEFSDGLRPKETVRKVTFAELRAKVHQTANLLTDLGVGDKDVVSVLMPAVIESQFVLWGAQAAGIVNPVNWMLEPEILVHMFKAAGTKVIVAYAGGEHAQVWHKLEAVAAKVPSVVAVVRLGGDGSCPATVGGVRVVDYGALIDRYPSNRLVSGRVMHPDDTASLFHTGGTTGAPKLARHLHRNQVFWVWASKYLSGFGDEEIRLVGVPIFHVAGAIVGCFGPLSRGASVVLMTSAGYRHPSVLPNLWKIVEAFRATTVTFVPTLVNQLLSISTEDADLSSVTYAACSTAPLSTTAAEAFYRKTGLRIRESYGMTETTAVTFITPPVETVKVGSSGLRLPYQQVRIVQMDTEGRIKRDCEAGEPGLVIVRGPAVFPGYLGQQKEDHWLEDGWLNTGDLGYLDEDAWLWITGRAKDLIIRGGHNIDPKMVEEALFGFDGVQDVAVVGAPDAHAGEVPVAYVVFKPGSTAKPEDLLRHAAQRVPERAAVPKHCFVLSDMPKTSVGKIQKNQLRVDAVQRTLQAALLDAGVEGWFDVLAVDQGAAGLRVEVNLDDAGQDQESKIEIALRGFPLSYVVRRVRHEPH